jgi:predicted dehydrogenase
MRDGAGEGINLYSTRLDEPDHLRGWRRLQISELQNAEQHYRKLAHLIDAVLDDRPLVMTGADGRDALELVLAIYRSAETGRPVTLPMPRQT